jgi:hypothetical protein
MTITQFNQLDEETQIDVAWKNGEIVASRFDEESKYILLQVFSFYVELRYNAASNVLDFVTNFVGTDLLEPYLNSINIDELLYEMNTE